MDVSESISAKSSKRKPESKREKGDNALSYYKGNIAQLLILVQLYCRRAIAREDAFPCPMDFDYSVETTFEEQARRFVQSKCACLQYDCITVKAADCCSTRVGGASGDDERNEKSCEWSEPLVN